MRVERVTGAEQARALAPGGASVADEVRRIVAAVREGGDAALHDHVERLDGIGDRAIRVSDGELDRAVAELDPAVGSALETAMVNVRDVAERQLSHGADVELEQGHTVSVRELPVRRAAIYVPGGRAPYPSTVVMGVVTAKVAGVDQIVVSAPGGDPLILAACRLCGADEVLRMGGAHAVAALAYGTETIERADVIAGPGGLYVQEAKRLVSADVGIDGFFGPSDLLVVADAGADARLVAADLIAQAEHGDGTVVALVTASSELLGAVADQLDDAQETGAVAALCLVEASEEALVFAEEFAPEHLQLVGSDSEQLLERVRSAGCVFVGRNGATAFGDYIAGSNHSLPTGGSARFASALSPSAFRRRMSIVRIGDKAASALARAGAPLADAEGFHLHAESMRLRENPSP